ncbi:hypothetical protein PGB90_000595 [Kerria lacca]
MRIGHSRLTQAYLLEKTPPPSCALCSVQFSIHHILIDYSKYRDFRNKFKLPASLSDILSDDPEITAKLFKFLRTSNLLTQP